MCEITYTGIYIFGILGICTGLGLVLGSIYIWNKIRDWGDGKSNQMFNMDGK